jgi:aspartyl-tRNA(Asn)/glutamyl-tRNA(Gln) amidotransferase subunit A
MPYTEYALPVYYLLAPAEASANLARYDSVRYGYSHPEAQDIWDAFKRTRQEGFGPEVKRRIMLGTYALSAGYYDAYYLKAQKVRTLIKQDFDGL